MDFACCAAARASAASAALVRASVAAVEVRGCDVVVVVEEPRVRGGSEMRFDFGFRGVEVGLEGWEVVEGRVVDRRGGGEGLWWN